MIGVQNITGLVLALERLEPCEGKLSRTVLRGAGGSNALCLPDKKTVKYIHKKILVGK